VLLDVVFQMTFARRRIYQALRQTGETPDNANKRLLSIISWWSVRSTVGWLIVAFVAFIARQFIQQTHFPSIIWWLNVGYTVCMCMGTAAALRLVTLSLNDDLRVYLNSNRNLDEMSDSPIQQGR
jgi:hypothetical protein